MILSAIFGSVAILSAGLNVWQCLAALRFPVNQRSGKRDFAPPITLLKPLKGTDDQTRDCLESWVKQDYPASIQTLFGVASTNDSVCEIVRDLQKTYSDRDIELVICDPILGANAKVATLTYLETKAKHPFWVISDADVFAPADLLAEIVQKFQKDEVSLVNCFYKLSHPRTIAMVWENIGVNADFWSQVCQSNSIKPMNFALGAVMAVRRGAFEKIGGFKPLLNYLADDYQIGRRLTDAGGKVELGNIVVECREGPKTFTEVWSHQLRWARTIRVCQPAPYFMSILSNVTLWMAADIAVAGWNPIAAFCIQIRLLTAVVNYLWLTEAKERRRTLWGIESVLAPVKDLLQFVVWLLSFTGNSVVWRGEKFLVKRGGELVKVQG